MDRNYRNAAQLKREEVALRKESVDRNAGEYPVVTAVKASLSARRAWIEIASGRWGWSSCPVALRKESVDRNKRNPPLIKVVS